MGKSFPKVELLQEIGVERSRLDALLKQLTPRQMTQGAPRWLDGPSRTSSHIWSPGNK
jgi:hypothetical protein